VDVKDNNYFDVDINSVELKYGNTPTDGSVIKDLIYNSNTKVFKDVSCLIKTSRSSLFSELPKNITVEIHKGFTFYFDSIREEYGIFNQSCSIKERCIYLEFLIEKELGIKLNVSYIKGFYFIGEDKFTFDDAILAIKEYKSTVAARKE